jgi:hypothetical protein
MLQKLGDHIAACHARAAECEARARETTDNEIKAEWIGMAKHWSHLAKSYEFAEMLERFLFDAYKKGSPFDLENLPKPPAPVD